MLESAGLVRGRREGRQHVWILSPRGLREASAHLNAIERQWDRAIERLRAYVEE